MATMNPTVTMRVVAARKMALKMHRVDQLLIVVDVKQMTSRRGVLEVMGTAPVFRHKRDAA